MTRFPGRLALGTQLSLNLNKSLSLNEKECIILNVIIYWLLAVWRRPIFMPCAHAIDRRGHHLLSCAGNVAMLRDDGGEMTEGTWETGDDEKDPGIRL